VRSNSRRCRHRYDKLIESFAAFVLLACIRIWINVCPRDLALLWQILLTPLLEIDFWQCGATLLWWLGDKFEDGLPHGWQVG